MGIDFKTFLNTPFAVTGCRSRKLYDCLICINKLIKEGKTRKSDEKLLIAIFTQRLSPTIESVSLYYSLIVF